MVLERSVGMPATLGTWHSGDLSLVFFLDNDTFGTCSPCFFSLNKLSVGHGSMHAFLMHV